MLPRGVANKIIIVLRNKYSSAAFTNTLMSNIFHQSLILPSVGCHTVFLRPRVIFNRPGFRNCFGCCLPEFGKIYPRLGRSSKTRKVLADSPQSPPPRAMVLGKSNCKRLVYRCSIKKILILNIMNAYLIKLVRRKIDIQIKLRSIP